MNAALEEEASITMPKGTLLVLFEYFSRSYDSWREVGDSSDEAPFALQQPDAGERKAIWRLEGEIERTLHEIFSADYTSLIADWKQHLTSQ